jgi:hypothetical protein
MKLRVLNLAYCPIQVSLEPLCIGCPNLEELNIMGDSWVKRQAIVGIAKHPKLMVLHMGHFEHSDFNCSESYTEHPPKVYFLSGLFDEAGNFPSLNLLWLERDCNFSTLLESLLKKVRPKLVVRMHEQPKLFGGQALVREGEEEEEAVDNAMRRYGIKEDDDDDIDLRFI